MRVYCVLLSIFAVVNNDGKTAVDLAKDYECIEAVELVCATYMY